MHPNFDLAKGICNPLWVWQRAQEITSASKRVVCLAVGTSDLTADLRARHTPSREPLLTSLSLCILAARASGTSVLDGVYLDFRDDEGFRNVCIQGRDLGFDGKTLIHPSQVGPANEVFGPSEEDIEWARRVLRAFDDAVSSGKGVATLDGKLVENLHAAEAKRIIDLAEAISF